MMFRVFVRRNADSEWQPFGHVNLAGVEQQLKMALASEMQVMVRSEVEGIDFVTEGDDVRYL